MAEVGICLLMTQHDFDIVGLARKVEELGFGSLWAPEHGVVPADFNVGSAGARAGAPSAYADGRINQIIDPLVYLAAAASATKTIKLGTGICLVPERNPIRLAKEVATLDLISGGRFIFGIGAGWLQGEAEVLGADFPRRWAQTREYIVAMKELWTGPVSEFYGRWVAFPPIICDPKPVQQPHPPVMIGWRVAAGGAEGGGLRRRLAAPRPQHVRVQRPGQAARSTKAHRGIVPHQRARPVAAEHHHVGRSARPRAEPPLLRRGGRPHSPPADHPRRARDAGGAGAGSGGGALGQAPQVAGELEAVFQQADVHGEGRGAYGLDLGVDY